MNTATKFLQSEIKSCAAQSHALMLRIITLKWGSLENAKRVGEIRAAREPAGAPLLRPKRRTLAAALGVVELLTLGSTFGEIKDRARHLLLAYAFLRGRAYASQEAKCTKAPSASWISSIIGEAGVEAPSAETIKAWIETKEASASASAAA